MASTTTIIIVIIICVVSAVGGGGGVCGSHITSSSSRNSSTGTSLISSVSCLSEYRCTNTLLFYKNAFQIICVSTLKHCYFVREASLMTKHMKMIFTYVAYLMMQKLHCKESNDTLSGLSA
jgi:hypothetical protein